MIEISEIVDAKSFKKWFNQLPSSTKFEKRNKDKIAAQIASRASLRILPNYLSWVANYEANFTNLPVLRCALISSIATSFNGSFAESFKTFDTSRAHIAAAIADGPAQAAALSARLNAELATSENSTADAFLDSIHYAIGDKGVAEILWLEVQYDCRAAIELSDAAPLWNVGKNIYAEEWCVSKRWFLDQDVDWSFWLDWYERAVAGRHVNWDMQHEIVLIDDDVWQGDAPVLMDQINQIRLKYAAADVCNGEVLVRSGDTGLIEAKVVTDVSDELSLEARERLKDLADDMRDALGRGNQLAMFADHPIKIERYLARYSHRPIRLFELAQDLYSAVDYAKNDGTCPDGDHFIDTYQAGLKRCELDLYSAEAEVRERVKQRNPEAFRKLQSEDPALLEAIHGVVREELEASLGDEMLDDTHVVFDETATQAERDHASDWLIGRYVKILALKIAEGGRFVGKVTVNRVVLMASLEGLISFVSRFLG